MTDDRDGDGRADLEAIEQARERWRTETLEPALDRFPERKDRFLTTSSIEVDRLYGPDSLGDGDGDGGDGWSYEDKLGWPGEYPYTRGVHPTMYRGRLWTMRQFAGFGTPEETNERFHYLLDQGQTGLSIAFDLPTLYCYDADDAFSEGEVGKCGVNVSGLHDMETVLAGIPLDEVSTSMTINAPAAIVWAYYLAVAKQQGVPLERLRGTTQNDILKEYQAQKEWIYPPEESMRLVVDTFEYGRKHVPKWNTISISGYHIREAGSTAEQELAFTLANGMEYVRWGIERGLDPDAFGPRLSFFFNCHNDLFEEVAKFRAARRIWADFMKNEVGAENERSWWLRFHTQTAGCSCTAQQPELNIVRTAFQALAAALGGTQSLHTNSYDEALALPTEKAVRIALRTQQILAHETGVTNTVDPLGGSYYVEWLTDHMEEEARRYFDRIDELGGVIPAIERGFFQREIADASWQYQQQIDEGERTIVGVNDYVLEDEEPMEILEIPDEVRDRQVDKLKKVKSERDDAKVEAALDALRRASEDPDENLMPHILDCVEAYATLQETSWAMKEVFGTWEEPLVF